MNDLRCTCGRLLIKNLSFNGWWYGEIKCNSCKKVNIIRMKDLTAENRRVSVSMKN